MSQKRRGSSYVYHEVRVICCSFLPEGARHGWYIAAQGWQAEIYNVGSADNTVAFMPKTDEKLLETNFMLSREHEK